MSKTNHAPTDASTDSDVSTDSGTPEDGDTPANGDAPADEAGSIHAAYAFGVRIREEASPDGDPIYRFEAPHHEGITFDDPDTAELYADVYFDVNGFQEAGTGDRGVPPAIIQAGRDTLVGYLLTQPDTDRYWIASYYGEKIEKIDRYVARVRKRARLIRERATERGVAESKG
ncbi:hypothetical protein [Halorubrum amylolyticum]|uniref:hypothetical protein n=1 Tax=Halorubrum amylolyticum TaxID=2508724 RepID=UPI00100904FD|nr:hypothetical protein [Halorubrum amylolyticum]